MRPAAGQGGTVTTYRSWDYEVTKEQELLHVATARLGGVHDLSATGLNEEEADEAIQARIDHFWQERRN